MSHIFPTIHIVSIVCILTGVALNSFAQKLPNKQEGSAAAPAKVKIDGKATEWTFKAYNNATEVFYTIAHDAENIYLVIKAEDESTVRKIVSSGITFSISGLRKKSDAEGATITYPLFTYKNMPYIRYSVKASPVDSVDYLVSINNKNFAQEGKFFKVSGIQGLSLVSVYNTDGIAVASSFDKDMHYTYELAIARKLVQPLISSEGQFSYRILLNAIQKDDIPGVEIKRDATGNVIGVNIEKILNGSLSFRISESAQLPTDFSGEYTLSN